MPGNLGSVDLSSLNLSKEETDLLQQMLKRVAWNIIRKCITEEMLKIDPSIEHHPFISFLKNPDPKFASGEMIPISDVARPRTSKLRTANINARPHFRDPLAPDDQ